MQHFVECRFVHLLQQIANCNQRIVLFEALTTLVYFCFTHVTVDSKRDATASSDRWSSNKGRFFTPTSNVVVSINVIVTSRWLQVSHDSVPQNSRITPSKSVGRTSTHVLDCVRGVLSF